MEKIDLMTPVKWMILSLDLAALLLTIRLLNNRRREQRQNILKTYTRVIWVYLVGGLVFSLPSMFITEAGDMIYGILFETVSVLCFVAAFGNMTESLIWDENGFDYWSMTGKKTRYGFENIKWIETNSYDRYGTIAYKIHMPDRKIGFDGMSVDIQPFLNAYNTWRSERKMGSWQKAAEKEWLVVYRSHSSFRKKLDRIDGGIVMLMICSVFGLLGIVLSVISLFFVDADPKLKLLIALFFLCFSLYLLSVWPAIAMIDRHPKWVRHYFYKWVRIRPDPDAKEKT